MKIIQASVSCVENFIFLELICSSDWQNSKYFSFGVGIICAGSASFLCELFQIDTDHSEHRYFFAMADTLWMYTQQSCWLFFKVCLKCFLPLESSLKYFYFQFLLLLFQMDVEWRPRWASLFALHQIWRATVTYTAIHWSDVHPTQHFGGQKSFGCVDVLCYVSPIHHSAFSCK